MENFFALLSVIFIACHFSEIKSQELTLPGEESSVPFHNRKQRIRK